MMRPSSVDLAQKITVGLLCAAVIGISGCGGGGTGLPGAVPGGNTGGGQTSRGWAGTALFHVDVPSGRVSITPLTGSNGKGRTAFAGATVGFTSSLLLDKPGDAGIKTLSVALNNHWALPLGQTSNGLVTGTRVIFSGFTNVSALTTDLRSKTQVSALAGSGSGFLDGSASSAKFKAPFGAATDASGAVYIGDTGNHRVRKIQNGQVSTLAGTGAAVHADGSGNAAGLIGPAGIAVNPRDRALIVAEVNGHGIRRITPDGAVTTVAGTGMSGSADGSGNSATFTSPIGVTVNSAGTIFVADQNGTIRRITLNNGANPRLSASYTVATFAGGAPDFADGVGSAAKFSSPSGIAVDGDGILYVADTANRRIRRIGLSGEVVTIAGTGVSGSADGTGDIATFGAPQGIVFANDALFVADNLKNNVRQIMLSPNAAPASSSSWRVATLAGTGAAGAINGIGSVATFSGPAFLAADSGGSLALVDRNNSLIRTVTPANGFFPIGIPTGSVSSEMVQMSDTDGLIPVPETGAKLNYIAYDGVLAPEATSPASNWNFVVPAGVTAFEFTVTVEAPTARLTPPEAVNNGGAGGAGSPNVLVRTLTGGVEGYTDGSLAAARFQRPLGVALDGAGNLYITDFNSSIRRIGANGIVSTIAGGKGVGYQDGSGDVARFSLPRGIAVNPDGTELYVADQNNRRVRRIVNFNPSGDVTNPANWAVTTIAGNGNAGDIYISTTGDKAALYDPFGIAWGPGETVYVSEASGNRIRSMRFTGGDAGAATNWTVSLLAGDLSAARGVGGDFDGTGSFARFSQPTYLALDRSGTLYVCDLTNKRVRTVTPDGNVKTLAGGVSGDTPAAGYVDGPAASGGIAVARFSFPLGIAVDSSGFVYVSDEAKMANMRIRRISPGGLVTTVAGTGVPGIKDGTGDIAQFNQPEGLAADAAGTLYVCDSFNSAVRSIQRVITGP